MSDLSAPHFAAHLDSVFQVELEARPPLMLRLFEVTEVDSGPWQEQFSLLFRGPEDRPLGQGICQMRHEVLGELALFIVPIGLDERGMQYEAVFNRVRPAASA